LENFQAVFGHFWAFVAPVYKGFSGNFKIAGKPDVSLVGASKVPILVSVIVKQGASAIPVRVACNCWWDPSQSQWSSLSQSSSIWLANAMIPKASEASKKTLNLLFSILQWGACFIMFFGPF
jgi:hypothetical protein